MYYGNEADRRQCPNDDENKIRRRDNAYCRVIPARTGSQAAENPVKSQSCDSQHQHGMCNPGNAGFPGSVNPAGNGQNNGIDGGKNHPKSFTRSQVVPDGKLACYE